jgi:very-short-patch-repair endonuclease
MRKTLSVRTDAAPKDSADKRWKPSAEREERLKERAREERRHMTEAEKALWERLSGAQMGGIKFTRKAVVGSTIVDFACSSRWLVVAITPEGVSAEVGELQDRKLADAKIRVLRFTDADVLSDLDRVTRQIAQTVNEPFERPDKPARPAPPRVARPGPRAGGPRPTGPRR